MVVKVSYVEMTPDGLLRHVVYLGEPEDNRLAQFAIGARARRSVTSASVIWWKSR